MTTIAMNGSLVALQCDIYHSVLAMFHIVC
uniref:Uncharacterized protein n=1 Tax=Anguilla anguilla TaxID=7936 RepID=A0A0E9RB36_ANGAN